MPKLLLFAPCHRAILDKADNSLSLVSVIHGLVVSPLPGTVDEPVPPNTVMPLNWSVGTVWLRNPDDGDKTFEQRVTVFTAASTKMETNGMPFQMTHRTHHLVMTANAFPLGGPGEYRLVLLLREVRPDGKWLEVAEYPIEIQYEQHEPQKAG